MWSLDELTLATILVQEERKMFLEGFRHALGITEEKMRRIA
ncbi:hypothetical protein [Viridibacillus soli]|nr:hypothetical protein [Viridibacillus soli]